jgi:hypothetical protein
MSQSLADTVDETIARLQEEQRHIREKDKQIDGIIAELKKVRESPRNLGLPPAVPGYLKGTPLKRAFEFYLKGRRGHKIPFERAVDDLLLAGVLPGAPRRNEHDPKKLLQQNLKILMSQRRDLVQWEPDGILGDINQKELVIRLADTADEPPKQRPRKQKP